ncbi:MAG: sulfatase-like hydrolase/transferase [Verrucomicrobia bacterium]|jgi:arylsulfatase A-like enzyme|nr:sulfatase-like hydrolase/transferase [Verrucomicrobiota bacterium]
MSTIHLTLPRLGFALLLVLSLISAQAADKKPNVIFLFADDMRADSIGALGNPTVKTPNLDMLVKRGFTLNNAYCLGGNRGAVCLPSRNMLLSGNTYFRWQDLQATGAGQKGNFAPATADTFPAVMNAAGYTTYHQGKKGNSATLIQAQFEINKYVTNDLTDRTNGEAGQQIVDEAIEFITAQKSEKPFFMYLGFSNPHDPRVAAEKYLKLYEREKIPLPKNYLPVHPFNNGEMIVRDETLSPWPRTEDEIRKTLHEYYAVISGMDYHIGRLLKKLEELKLTENTIVIFSADQGISVGSHGLLGKQNLYDHGMKVPLFVAGPGVKKGKSDAMVYLLDIFPSVCELAGVKVPAGLDGKSFAPVIQGKADKSRETLFLAYRDVQRAIRDERWKLIRYPQVDVTQLFDLKNDPDELKNLAGEAAQKERVRNMLAQMADWQKKLNDAAPLTVDNPASPKWAPPSAEEFKANETKKKKNKQ